MGWHHGPLRELHGRSLKSLAQQASTSRDHQELSATPPAPCAPSGNGSVARSSDRSRVERGAYVPDPDEWPARTATIRDRVTAILARLANALPLTFGETVSVATVVLFFCPRRSQDLGVGHPANILSGLLL